MNYYIVFILLGFINLINAQTSWFDLDIIGNCSKINSFGSSDINRVSRKLVQSTDWFTGVSVRTYNGEVPWVPCPVGYYRIIKNKKLNHRIEGCLPCPKGRYGSTIGLTSSMCSAPCPKGRYGDFKGASNQDDCLLCPPDTYGASEGLTSPYCSGKCPLGTYSPKFGSTSFSNCIKCPPNYFGNQCSEQLDLETEINKEKSSILTNNYQPSKNFPSQNKLTSKINLRNTGSKCGGLNNVCTTQHVVSLM